MIEAMMGGGMAGMKIERIQHRGYSGSISLGSFSFDAFDMEKTIPLHTLSRTNGDTLSRPITTLNSGISASFQAVSESHSRSISLLEFSGNVHVFSTAGSVTTSVPIDISTLFEIEPEKIINVLYFSECGGTVSLLPQVSLNPPSNSIEYTLWNRRTGSDSYKLWFAVELMP